MNRYYCSDGTRVNERQIKEELRRALSIKRSQDSDSLFCHAHEGKCSMSLFQPSLDADHTIAKARCKHLWKTELIWDVNNIEWSCRSAHEEWERYKSGRFRKHANFEKRMAYMKIHDPEGWDKRMNFVNTRTLKAFK